MRGSSSTGCNGAKDTPIFPAGRNKRIISDHHQDEQAIKRVERYLPPARAEIQFRRSIMASSL
jgi:hypothetical protein